MQLGILPPTHLSCPFQRNTQDSIHSFKDLWLPGTLPGPGLAPGDRDRKVDWASAPDFATHTPAPGTRSPQTHMQKMSHQAGVASDQGPRRWRLLVLLSLSRLVWESFRLFPYAGPIPAILAQAEKVSYSATCLPPSSLPPARLSSAPHRLMTPVLSSPAQISLLDTRLGHQLSPRHLHLALSWDLKLNVSKANLLVSPPNSLHSSCAQLIIMPGPKASEAARSPDPSLALPPQPNLAANPVNCTFKTEPGNDFLDLTPKT